MKKGLLLGVITASTAIACSAGFILGNKGVRIEAAKAGGKDRTLVFDKDVANVAQGNGAIASVGSMRAYTNTYTSLENGFAKAEDGKVCIYYNEIVGSGYNCYHGFEDASVTSLTIQYKADNDTFIYAEWGSLSAAFAISKFNDSTTTADVSKSDEIQTLTFNSGNFINNQETAKSSVYPVICIRTYGSVAVSFYSITVNYTCK